MREMSKRPVAPRMRRIIASGASLTVGAALVVGCGSSHSSGSGAGGTSGSGSGHAANAGQLQISPQGALETFNPWAGGNGLNGSMLFLNAVYDSLLNVNDQGKVVPGLATSWTVSKNKRVVKLKLRSGVKFTDGTPFTAQTVKANFDYAQTTKNPGQCNSDVAGVKTTPDGAQAVTLTLTKPNPDLLLNLATCAGWMVSQKGLADPSKLTNTPDGSGPYTYDAGASESGLRWVFNKTSGHWDSSQYPFSSVKFTLYSTENAMDNAARSGQVDVSQSIVSTDTASGLKLYETQPTLFRGIAIGDLDGKIIKPLANPLVRQAMNYAVDRAAILKGVDNGIGVVNGASTPFINGGAGWTSALNNMYPYDVAKAKALMAKAGYPNGFSLPVMDAPTDVNEALAQAIASYEAKIGIKMTVVPETSTYIPDMLSGKKPSFFGQYTLSGALYQNLVGTASPTAFWNPEHASNSEFNRLLKTLQTASGAQLTSTLQKFAVAYGKQAWWIAPVNVPQTVGYDASKVKLVVTDGNPNPLLYQIQPAS